MGTASASPVEVEVSLRWGDTLVARALVRAPQSFYLADSLDGGASAGFVVPPARLGRVVLPLLLPGPPGALRAIIPSETRGTVELPGHPSCSIAEAIAEGLLVPGTANLDSHELLLAPGCRIEFTLPGDDRAAGAALAIELVAQRPDSGMAPSFRPLVSTWGALPYVAIAALLHAGVFAAAGEAARTAAFEDDGVTRDQLFYMQEMLEVSAEEGRAVELDNAQSFQRDLWIVGFDEAKDRCQRKARCPRKLRESGPPPQDDAFLSMPLGWRAADAPRSEWDFQAASEWRYVTRRGGPGFARLYPFDVFEWLAFREEIDAPLSARWLGGALPGGSGPGGKRPPQGEPRIRGELPEQFMRSDPDLVRAAVRSRRARFHVCYSQGLANNPVLQGRLTVSMRIGADGRVGSVTRTSEEIPDDSVALCLMAALRLVQIERPPPEAEWVTYVLTLRPPQQPEKWWLALRER